MIAAASFMMGPHRGIQIKVIETHGIAGGFTYTIEREPFWMEITPQHIEQLKVVRARWFT